MERSEYTQRARDFLAFQRVGVLSTHSIAAPGYPFGSLTPYDIDAQGRFIIYISLIAEHFGNLAACAHASLTVLDRWGGSDPQQSARSTVLADFAEVPPEEIEAVKRSYLRRFPEGINHEIAHNFRFLRALPRRVRWIGGFGEIGWIDGEAFTATLPDPLSYEGMRIVDHLNIDHSSALRELAEYAEGRALGKTLVQACSITTRALTLLIQSEESQRRIELSFQSPATESAEARREIIRLLEQARR